MTGPVTLDGVLDEPAWQGLESLPITMHAPTFGAPITERTEIMVAYDESYLYLAGRLYDSDPSGVRSTTLYRDQYSGDDLVSIVLDTYNDYESAVWFTANPVGVRSDRSVSNDADFSKGRAMNNDWNSYWDVATTQTDEGWFVEMRIPFSSLGFQDHDGHVEMGMIVYRFIARKNERQTFPAIAPDWRMAFAKPSQSQRVSLEGVYAQKPVYITPYVLGGLERVAELNGLGTAYDFNVGRTNEIGVDVKYNLTSNLTLDATINTDFAQVEVDSQQVNLTRYSLFFPEKRMFFQERSSLFDFNTGGFSRLFHSRRIGLNDTGDQVRILGGLRLVGRVGGTDVGFLNMQTASQAGLPSENFGVARLRRQVFNPYSTIGAMATTRTDGKGSFAATTGFDTSVRVFGDEYFSAAWIATFARDTLGTAQPDVFDASRFLVGWERRNETGFSYSAKFVRSGTDYAPRMGFAPRSDYTQWQNGLQYRKFAGAESVLRTVGIQSRSSVYLRNFDGTVESVSIQPELEFEMKNGRRITLSMENSFESVRNRFYLSGVTPIEPGDYWFHEGELRFALSRSSLLRGGASVRGGTFYDGWRVAVAGGPTVSFSKHLEVGGNYEINMVRFSDRGESLNAHLARLRVQTAMDIHLSATALFQYSSTSDRLGVNARVRYHFREGSDLWIVYNDIVNTDRQVLIGPMLPVSQVRTVMVKYTYTLGG
ncbi:MAG: carbohydrate binding family 9 domain-containing protein [Gemmatimonadota bacterium]|nr:carbohydrate binding family 9 domain-containing protein [Gemmatimonadota bacterium]